MTNGLKRDLEAQRSECASRDILGKSGNHPRTSQQCAVGEPRGDPFTKEVRKALMREAPA